MESGLKSSGVGVLAMYAEVSNGVPPSGTRDSDCISPLVPPFWFSLIWGWPGFKADQVLIVVVAAGLSLDNCVEQIG